MRSEGSNAYQRLFHSAQAVVDTSAPTRGAVVVRELMDGHRPAVWVLDSYTAQQGHAAEHQTCLAQISRARDQLLAFLAYLGKVEPTDNAFEGLQRPAVVQRKVTNGYRAMWAAEGEVAIRTVVDTARLSGADPFGSILETVGA